MRWAVLADAPHLRSQAHRREFGLAADELGRRRNKLSDLRIVRSLRPVALGGDHAQESERLVTCRAELVPCHRRNVDHVEHRDGRDRVAHQHLAAASDDHDGMLMVVALQRGVPASTDLEIAKLNRQIALTLPEGLPSDVAKMRALFLVGVDVHALPPVIRLMMSNHALHLYDG